MFFFNIIPMFYIFKSNLENIPFLKYLWMKKKKKTLCMLNGCPFKWRGNFLFDFRGTIKK